jgi:hypothetical protein
MDGYPKRLYHPDLGVEIETANAEQHAVYAESGWLEAPEPKPVPGYVTPPMHYVRGDDGKFQPGGAHLYAPDADAEPPAKAKRATKTSRTSKDDEDPDN